MKARIKSVTMIDDQPMHDFRTGDVVEFDNITEPILNDGPETEDYIAEAVVATGPTGLSQIVLLRDLELIEDTPEFLFHGGCHGCTQQTIHGTAFCMDCRYFDAEWHKPDLNNRAKTKAEKERDRLKAMKERG